MSINVMRYTKRYTMEEWVRFDRDHTKVINGKKYSMSMQEYLCKKYKIIITDYRTKQQRRVDKVNKTIDGMFSGIDKFCNGVDKVFNGIDKGLKVIDDIAVSVERETAPAKKRKGIKSKTKKQEWDGWF